MQRTQISITVQQANRLKQAASDRGISMSHVVREAIEAYVVDHPADRETRTRRARSAAGRFSSGREDIGERHDDYLADDPRGW